MCGSYSSTLLYIAGIVYIDVLPTLQSPPSSCSLVTQLLISVVDAVVLSVSHEVAYEQILVSKTGNMGKT